MNGSKKLILFSMAVIIAIASNTWGVQSSIKAGDITGSKKAPYVNIAIFYKLHGQEDFTYPASIDSQDILHAMEGKAQFISLNHTAGVIDGDILMSSNDVLREAAGSAFEDFGVDCQLSAHIASGDVTLAGLCQILMIDQDGRQIEHKAIVKATTLKAGKHWVLLYYDAEDGIAIYADQEVGRE